VCLFHGKTWISKAIWCGLLSVLLFEVRSVVHYIDIGVIGFFSCAESEIFYLGVQENTNTRWFAYWKYMAMLSLF
jgi:hypothetical protein